MSTVRDVLGVLDGLAPRYLALDGDPGGLLVGDPQAPVERVGVALDATRAVVEAAVRRGIDLIVAHHPLIYHPLKAARADDPVGGIVLACARAGVAVAAAHTNWDVAPGGINDVLAGLLGLTNTRPLQMTYREPLVKIAVFVPREAREGVLDAMAGAGAGALGNYDRCAFMTVGTGTFRPLPGADPYVGTVGEPEAVPEERLEMIVPEARSAGVIAAMKNAHPYEEVAYDVYALANAGEQHGIGRVGTLPRRASSEEFVQSVKDALAFPEVRVAGPEDRGVKTVAVCGGAGAFLMGDALSAGADAFVTSDVRHHEFVEAAARGLLLLDAGHAATETPGTRELARRLAETLAPGGIGVSFFLADGTEEAPDEEVPSG